MSISPRAIGAAKVAISTLTVLLGLGMVLIAVTIGHCSAFGGTCPAEAPPLWEDDVFGTAFAGTALAMGVPMWMFNTTKRGLVKALLVAGGLGVLVGLMARTSVLG